MEPDFLGWTWPTSMAVSRAMNCSTNPSHSIPTWCWISCAKPNKKHYADLVSDYLGVLVPPLCRSQLLLSTANPSTPPSPPRDQRPTFLLRATLSRDLQPTRKTIFTSSYCEQYSSHAHCISFAGEDTTWESIESSSLLVIGIFCLWCSGDTAHCGKNTDKHFMVPFLSTPLPLMSPFGLSLGVPQSVTSLLGDHL